eukprot:scaffold17494_cov103-Isochrysis_galbana.AAC.2
MRGVRGRPCYACAAGSWCAGRKRASASVTTRAKPGAWARNDATLSALSTRHRHGSVATTALAGAAPPSMLPNQGVWESGVSVPSCSLPTPSAARRCRAMVPSMMK